MPQNLLIESSFSTYTISETCKIPLRIKMAQLGTRLQTQKQKHIEICHSCGIPMTQNTALLLA